jgi:transketolase
MRDIKRLEQVASQVRRDIVRMVTSATCGHPGGSLGCADFLVALYFDIMKHNKNFDMNGVDEDLFFLSNGHISPVWYSVLGRSGYFNIDELKTFRKLNSRLQGHPATEEGLPGIRVASGSVAIGAALSKKINKDTKTVFSLHGDGELQEGQIWEAAMFAAHHKVDNLISTVDYNNRQIDGVVSDVMSLGDLKAKWESFGWRVLEANGNVMSEIIATLDEAKKLSGNGYPIVILMKTEMGFGVDYMMGTHKWHGVAPNEEQCLSALGQLEETLGDY